MRPTSASPRKPVSNYGCSSTISKYQAGNNTIFLLIFERLPWDSSWRPDAVSSLSSESLQTSSVKAAHTCWCCTVCHGSEQRNMPLTDLISGSWRPSPVTSPLHQRFLWPHGTNIPPVGWWHADVARSSHVPVNKSAKFPPNVSLSSALARTRSSAERGS